MIRSINNPHKYKWSELVISTPAVLLDLRRSIRVFHNFDTTSILLVMLAINITTAAKLLVLLNISVLLLLVGAAEVSTSLFV